MRSPANLRAPEVTLQHRVGRRVTLQHPEERPPPAPPAGGADSGE